MLEKYLENKRDNNGIVVCQNGSYKMTFGEDAIRAARLTNKQRDLIAIERYKALELDEADISAILASGESVRVVE